MNVFGTVLLALGALVLLLAATGLFVFHDALSRQHAATKAGSLGVVLIVLGAALLGGDAGWAGRAAVIVAIVWMTMPVASHVLARAALRTLDSKTTRASLSRLPNRAARPTARSGNRKVRHGSR